MQSESMVERMSRTRGDTVILPKLPTVEQIEEDFQLAPENDPAFTAGTSISHCSLCLYYILLPI